MKRLFSMFLAALILGQSFVLLLPSMAKAAIETRNYGWILGKYDATKKIFTPSDITSINWNDMTVRTIGPWSVYQNSSSNRVGSIISFVDKNRPQDNGYPMIGEPQWDQWITQFKGNKDFVKSALNTWNIDTNSGKFKFANFSQLVELCGGKGQSYNIANASSVYLSSEPPYATLLSNRTAVQAGESVIFTIRGQSNTYFSQFIDVSFAGAGQTIWTDKRFTGPRMDSTYTNTFNTPGTYTFSIIVKDSVWRTATSKVTVAVGPKDAPLPPAPLPPAPEQPKSEEPDEPDEPVDVNQAPTARFGWPAECWEGDTVNVIENSYDRDGEIIGWRWRFTNTTGITHNLKQGGGQVTFQNSGTYELRLTVEDNDGATDSITKTISVKPPIPVAKIDYIGVLKENRKITLDASESGSPSNFPIDFTKSEWTIVPVSGGTASDIKLGSKGEKIQDILFKKAGTYKVGLRVYNDRYPSEWVYTDIVIGPDLPPVANFLTSSVVFRKPTDQNNAAIKLYDISYSTDYDPLAQRIWKYKFDSNNNGVFTDESWIAIDSGNNLQPVVKTTKVGRYLFELEVKEGFAQETIPQFISDADYLRDNTNDKPLEQKIVDVQNIAPTTEFTSTIKSKIDIVFSQGFLTNYSTRFPGLQNNLEAIVGTKLKANGIDYAFYNTGNQGTETIYRQASISDKGDQINPLDYPSRGYPQKDRDFDLGKNLSRNDISVFTLNFAAHNDNAAGTKTYAFYISPDNVTWTKVKQWTSLQKTDAMSGDYLYVNENILPAAIPLDSFRYTRVRVESGYCIDSCSLGVTANSSPRAALADLQNKANESYRTGATKYIVSLAEEPYVDANATTLNNTANSLDQNKTFLIIFTNNAALSSVQQLTSKLDKQKIIMTATDLSPALNELADYIISQKPTNEMSGFIPILLEDALVYSPTYSDYENDPKYAENWYISHEPNFVDNPTGLSVYNNKTYAAPPAIFDKVGQYDIQYKAQDNPAGGDTRFSNYFLWSTPVPTSVVVHRKPIAQFTVQAGTLYITDLSYDPDFQYKRPDKGLIEWFWQWKKITDSSWTLGKPTASITQPGNYYFYLKVKDIYGVWSDPYQMAITVTDPNRPPVVDFNWTPVLIYEGDQVTLNNLTYDPDSDPLTYQWTVYNPLGVTNTYTTKNVTLNKVLPGTYWITLRAWDSKNATDVATKSFLVNPLEVNGQVRHTGQWEQKRIAYNLSVSGSENNPRGYDVFWAGERFILNADTTDTGSSTTKAQSVTVIFPYGDAVSLSANPNQSAWYGEMWQTDFENIPDGSYNFIFTAVYTNGTVKTQNVRIVVSGTIYSFYQFHRTQ